jgi:hypothetical protein
MTYRSHVCDELVCHTVKEKCLSPSVKTMVGGIGGLNMV